MTPTISLHICDAHNNTLGEFDPLPIPVSGQPPAFDAARFETLLERSASAFVSSWMGGLS